MSNYVSTYGLDLPVYASNADVRYPFHINNLPATQTSFIRIVDIEDYSRTLPNNLKEVLKIADECFDQAASLCDAQTIKHTWALHEKPRASQERILPKGFSLVAEVNLIDDIGHTVSSEEAVLHGLSVYKKQHANYKWDDAKPNQFTRAIPPGKDTPMTLLHDIDIYIRKS